MFKLPHFPDYCFDLPFSLVDLQAKYKILIENVIVCYHRSVCVESNVFM